MIILHMYTFRLHYLTPRPLLDFVFLMRLALALIRALFRASLTFIHVVCSHIKKIRIVYMQSWQTTLTGSLNLELNFGYLYTFIIMVAEEYLSFQLIHTNLEDWLSIFSSLAVVGLLLFKSFILLARLSSLDIFLTLLIT